MDSPTGRYSVAFPRRWWYAASASSDLGRKAPLGITLMDEPVVLFRDATGRVRALADRCPHRNVPLSEGRVGHDGCLQCGYHGWRFSGDGTCVEIPGLATGPDAAAANRSVPTWPTVEQDGFVWIWADPATVPTHEPRPFVDLDGPGSQGEVVFHEDLDSTVHAALENALDVPHTAFLHGGIFRGGDARDITAVRREIDGGIEVQYVGEPIGFSGFRARDDSELTFDHWDRFLMPATAEIEYRVRGWLQIVNTIVHLPLSEFRTRAWFVLRWRSPLPAAVVRPIVLARGTRVVRQDVEVLARQTANARTHGGERYTSTELDVMGNAIWRMLRRAERNEAPADVSGNGQEPSDDHADDDPIDRTVTLRI